MIEDENGEKQSILNAGGLFFDEKLFTSSRNLNNTKAWPLLNDDIVLATCPKTGKRVKILKYC